MADHTLLAALKERLGISTTDHDTELNRYLTDEEKVRGLSVTDEAEAVVITMFAESDFYRFLSNSKADRVKYSEGNRSIDGTKSAAYYRDLANDAKDAAEDALSVVEESRGPAIRYLRDATEKKPAGITEDVNSPDYEGDSGDDDPIVRYE